MRSRDDPDEVWRCCPFWPRTLVNKWNAREFAARHGCELPELYWTGGPLTAPPLESLPDHYVVRPYWGAGRRGVLAMSAGRELLSGEPVGRKQLHKALSRRRRAVRWMPILIEEFVKAEDGSHQFPVELKCHTFGDTVAAIEVLERTGVRAHSRRCYTPEWEPFDDPLHGSLPQAAVRGPPRGLDQMVSLAARIGASVGTYIRVDFFAGERTCVFNEISATPQGGRGYTPFCEKFFGELWERRFANAT
jgi:hypothetical protein